MNLTLSFFLKAETKTTFQTSEEKEFNRRRSDFDYTTVFFLWNLHCGFGSVFDILDCEYHWVWYLNWKALWARTCKPKAAYFSLIVKADYPTTVTMYWPSVQDDWKNSAATTVAELTTRVIGRSSPAVMKGLLVENAVLARQSVSCPLQPVITLYATLLRQTTTWPQPARRNCAALGHSASEICLDSRTSSHPQHLHHNCSRWATSAG